MNLFVLFFRLEFIGEVGEFFSCMLPGIRLRGMPCLLHSIVPPKICLPSLVILFLTHFFSSPSFSSLFSTFSCPSIFFPLASSSQHLHKFPFHSISLSLSLLNPSWFFTPFLLLSFSLRPTFRPRSTFSTLRRRVFPRAQRRTSQSDPKEYNLYGVFWN